MKAKKYKYWVVEYERGEVGTFSSPIPVSAKEVKDNINGTDGYPRPPRVLQVFPSVRNTTDAKTRKSSKGK